MWRQSNWLWASGLGLWLTAGGCANFVDGDGAGSQGGGSAAATDGKRLSAALTQAKDCPDLLAKLKADAIAKLDLEIVLFKREIDRYGVDRGTGGFDTGVGGTTGSSGDFLEGGAITDGPTAPPPAVNGTGAPGRDGSTTTGGSEFGADGDRAPVSDPIGGSDTNNQVSDVDEADFVKMVEDRTHFYLLHGRQLYSFASWPPESLSTVGSPLPIEGSPSEMFVRDGKAVVFSWVDRSELGLSYEDNRYQPFTKLTVVDLGADGDALEVERELYIEGQYASSRRYDDLVRVVLQADSPAPARFYPDIQPYDAFGNLFPDAEIDAQLEAWRERTASSIESTELSDWLPSQYEREDGELSELTPACESHYTPTAGASEAGLTRVVTLDLADVGAGPDGVTVMGASSLVYSNLEAMVLAHNDYRWDARDFGLIDEQRVALHLFELDGEATRYQASGWAPGHVLNQFALDEKDGVVRVSTSGWVRVNPEAEEDDAGFWQTTSKNQVVTLQPKEGELKEVGNSGPIGKPDETTRSTRFIGDRAYVVTFLQTDPLIVVDLSNPKDLQVLGELEIPGFSEYMHPLGDHHLLTIGQDGDDRGLTGGIALQIFDVEDPTDPQLSHRHAFSPGSSSSASYDHKAFTFYDAQGLLAFPMVDYGGQFSSTLQVFEVSVKSGFEPLGAVDHTAFYDQCSGKEPFSDFAYYDCWYQPDVRRGMFVEGEDGTYVYTVSHGGVTVHDVDALDAALGSVQLPEPQYYEGGYFRDEIWF